MRGIDVVGASEDGLIDAGATGAKALVNYLKKPDEPAKAPITPVSTPSKSEKKEGNDGDGFFSKTIAGPVRVWHATVGAALAGAGGWWFFGRKK